MTAKLQTTVKQMAKSAGVSERTMYDAIKLRRSGREDLGERVRSGEISINTALVLAGLRQKPGAVAKLKRGWLNASASERIEFAEWLTQMVRGSAEGSA